MIISISGKIGSGKDTVGKLINFLLTGGLIQYESIEGFLEYYTDGIEEYPFKIKKFAIVPKQMLCLMLGCTMDDLEDREFKEKELGEEWWYIKLYNKMYPYSRKNDFSKEIVEKYLVKLTPRKLLQLLGTECGREIIHPNIWVNALMSEYNDIPTLKHGIFIPEDVNEQSYDYSSVSKWIITDMRFPNELKAVKDKGGISIRVNREYTRKEWYINNSIPEFFTNIEDSQEIISKETFIREIEIIPLELEYFVIPSIISKLTHPSETALDNAESDYVIDNGGTIEELIEKVKKILIKEKLL